MICSSVTEIEFVGLKLSLDKMFQLYFNLYEGKVLKIVVKDFVCN